MARALVSGRGAGDAGARGEGRSPERTGEELHMRRVRRHLLGVIPVLVLMSLFVEPAQAAGDTPSYRLASPDKSIRVRLELDKGAPSYRIAHNRRPLVARSALGLQLQGMPALDGDFEVRRARRTTHNSAWSPVWGEYDRIADHYNELTVELREVVAPRRTLRVVFRAYDDGVGFRYVLPEQPGIGEFAMTAEDTEFNFADDFTAWWIPAQFGAGSGDEELFRQTPLSEMQPAATPVTIDAGAAGYATLHEADLIDYATMMVEPVGGGAPSLRSALVPMPDGVVVRGTVPHRSPWRTLVIGDKPADLIESTLILDLNPPCAICDQDLSWIRPGKYVGVWWEIHKGKSEWSTAAALPHGATTENVKRYIDFAAAHGASYVLSEGWNEGWATMYTMQNFLQPTPDFDLEGVVAYAKSKGVDWIAHTETGGNVTNFENQMEAAFSLYESLGVPGVKTGYAGGTSIGGVEHAHYDQPMVNHYRDVIRRAAAHHLVVEAHEMVKDTGERRTYPNIMTREAVRGLEWEAWSEGNPPEHLVEVPFTRMVAGPVSYTPGIFNITWDPGGPGRPPWRTLEHTRVHSTRAAQLAIYPVYLSGLQMMADVPENYEGQPGLEFLEQVPTTWDDTVALNGRVGDYVTVARRSGRDWFIGSINDEQPKTLSVPLRSLLRPGVRYVAEIYGDAPTTDYDTNPDEIEITRIIVHRRDVLKAPMTTGGGQAVHLRPATREDLMTLPGCGQNTPLCTRP
jgi:alpha-glucosidase